jgi:protocatechuate 3,4-dioxygenase beta subunit
MSAFLGLMLLASNIHGIVTDAAGAPVANARVILRDDASARAEYGTLSSTDGTFSFKDIAPGRYRLLAEKNGYIAGIYGQRQANGPGLLLVFPDSADRAGDQQFRIRLTPAGSISGRVLDENGEPLLGADVSLYRKRTQSGEVGFVQVTAVATTTNDLGEYRAYGLSPGKYFVGVTYPSNSSPIRTPRVDQSSKTQDSIPTFFPAVDDPASATAIDVTPGSDARGVDVTLNRARYVRIRGKLVGCSYANPESVIISVTRRVTGIPLLRFSRDGRVLGADGTFEILRVPTGSYQLTALVRQGSWTVLPIEVGGRDIDDLVVACTPRVELSGTVRMDDDGGIPPAVDIEFQAPNFGGPAYGVTARPDGTFTGRDFRPGNYRVFVRTKSDKVFVKSITSGRRDLLADGVVFDGPVPDPIQIVLSNKAASIDGTVLDENQKPAVNVRVVLIPRIRSREDLYVTTQTDENGRFQFKGLSPTDYELYAWEYVDADSYHDPDFLMQYRSRAKTIHLDPGATVTLTLPVL